jgi:DNA mismatch endonuclease, patch repair protein
MVDIVDSATRSRMMSGIRGRDTKPEKLIRSLLHRRGFRFRINRRDLPGKPDIVFPGRRAVILVHGCFWHGHDCPLFRLPGTRTEFWDTKIAGNRANDARVKQALLDDGWRVGTVWECALRGRDRDIPGAIDALAAWLQGDAKTIELRGPRTSAASAAEVALPAQ